MDSIPCSHCKSGAFVFYNDDPYFGRLTKACPWCGGKGSRPLVNPTPIDWHQLRKDMEDIARELKKEGKIK